MSVLPSSPTAVVAPPIFIGAWFAMPGIPVIARSTPDRRGISCSLNVSVRRFVAPTVALAAGVELTSLGWASAGVDRPIDRIAIRAANLVFVFIEHLRWVRCTLRSLDAYPSLPSPD